MALDLPEIGQANWGPKLNAALQSVNASLANIDTVTDASVERVMQNPESDARVAVEAFASTVADSAVSSAITPINAALSGRLSPASINTTIEDAINVAPVNPQSWATRLAWAGQRDRIAFAAWRTAIANMGTAPARILHVGDSLTEGTGVTAVTDTWVVKLANRLRDYFPAIAGNAADSIGYTATQLDSGGSGTIVLPWVITGGYVPGSVFNLRRGPTPALNAGSYIQGTVVGTSIDIFYSRGSAAKTFTVTVDGGAASTLGADGGSGSGHRVRVSLGAAGSHTVRITATGNYSFIEGITVYNGNENSGIVTANAGHHGWTSNQWVADPSGMVAWKESVAAYAPHLVTIMLGTNDYTAVGDPVTYRTNITALVAAIRAAVPSPPSIVLIAPHRTASPGMNPAVPWEEYERPLLDLAQSLGCGYVDLRMFMPDPGTPAGTVSGYYVDTVHLSAAGHEKVATELAGYFASRV